MRTAINIPYFLPYLRYFQVIASVDCHVCEVETQFNRWGYAHRHKLPLGKNPSWIGMPVKFAPHTTLSCQIQILDWKWTKKFFRSIEITYHRAPNYARVRALLERILADPTPSLADLCIRSTKEVCSELGIHTRLVDSREAEVDKSLRREGRIFAICKCMSATEFVNREEGRHLYSVEPFVAAGLGLRFFRSLPIPETLAHGYHPAMGGIDFLMRVPPEQQPAVVRMYDLVA